MQTPMIGDLTKEWWVFEALEFLCDAFVFVVVAAAVVGSLYAFASLLIHDRKPK